MNENAKTRCSIGMEQCTLKNVSNCLNTNVYSYLETSGGPSYFLYLNVVHFLKPVLIRHLWQLKTVVFLHWCIIRAALLLSGLYYRRVMIIIYVCYDCGLYYKIKPPTEYCLSLRLASVVVITIIRYDANWSVPNNRKPKLLERNNVWSRCHWWKKWPTEIDGSSILKSQLKALDVNRVTRFAAATINAAAYHH